MFYDLHTHTTCSDGDLTPLQLLHLAKERGIPGLAITDHDTVDAFSDEVMLAAERMDLFLGVGIEISTIFEGHSIHVLGYNFDPKHEKIIAFSKNCKQRRSERNQKIVDKLKIGGFPIDWDDSKGSGRPHIAQQMMKKGYVSSLKEAFDKYIGEGKPYYAPGAFPTTQEACDLIHEIGGKAFVAHPHLIKSVKVVKRLLKLPFDGLECYYGLQNHDQNLYYVALATSRHMLVCGGTDYHGASSKPHYQLGSRGVSIELVRKIFPKLSLPVTCS